jgi:hypothetical protein
MDDPRIPPHEPPLPVNVFSTLYAVTSSFHRNLMKNLPAELILLPECGEVLGMLADLSNQAANHSVRLAEIRESRPDLYEALEQGIRKGA